MHEFVIPEMRDDFRFMFGDTGLDRILRSLVAEEPVQDLTPKPLYDLRLYKAGTTPTYGDNILITNLH